MRLASLFLVPALAIGSALAFATPAAAQPSPAARLPVALGGVSVGVGVGFGVPVRERVRPVRVAHGHRVRAEGYWTIQTERVFVPGRLIGYDFHGHPIQSAGYWTERHVRVWVPAPRPVVVRRAPVRRGGYVRFGYHGH